MSYLLALLALIGSATGRTDTTDHVCEAAVAISEARNQGDAGMYAVIRAVRNRAIDTAHRWPRTSCAVATQAHQFQGIEHWRTPANNATERAAVLRAFQLASGERRAPALNGECTKTTSFDRSVTVPRGLRLVCKIGAHNFYTEPRGTLAAR